MQNNNKKNIPQNYFMSDRRTRLNKQLRCDNLIQQCRINIKKLNILMIDTKNEYEKNQCDFDYYSIGMYVNVCRIEKNLNRIKTLTIIKNNI